jgi:formylglycine-generating enzyme required for sulfatase activity
MMRSWRPGGDAGLVLTFLLLAFSVSVRPSAQAPPEPCELDGALPLDQIVTMVPSFSRGRIDLMGIIKRCGVKFILDEKGAADLKKIGATDQLIGMLMPPVSASVNTSWTSYTDGRDMGFVGAGEFQMGSPPQEPGRKPDEAQSPIRIQADFWMDRDEVTNDAFQRFVRANPDWSKDKVGGQYLKDWTGDRYPANTASDSVVHVTWKAARAYAAWAGKRLPTEAECEYAARAGSQSAYWWGSVFISDHANAEDQPWSSGITGTTPGGAKNGWGLVNMLGNVWEWTSSVYQPYPYRDDGRESPDAPGDRVVRGGSFGNDLTCLRSAKRHAVDPGSALLNVGFRCALSAHR